jgi:gamma-glutamyltranspeptidase/glutathione hydrolase
MEGPDYFLCGGWARRLVEEANGLGWMISLEDVAGYDAIWVEPTHTLYKENELIGIPPPQRGGFYTGFLFGVLEHFELDGHYTESAETLGLIAWILRRAHLDRNLIHDPCHYDNPLETLLSGDYHNVIADLWKKSRPKTDLTRYLELTYSKSAHIGS